MANEALEGVNFIRKLRMLLHVKPSSVRPHLNNRDFIYDQPLNKYLSNRIESDRYKASLAITGAIKGSFRDKYSRNYV